MKRMLVFLLLLLLGGCAGGAAPLGSPSPTPTAAPSPATAPRIVDRTQLEEIGCDTAEEVFWQDETYSYVFPCVKSQYVSVLLPEGTELSLQAALDQGVIVPADLEDAGIAFSRVRKADESQVRLGRSREDAVSLSCRPTFSMTYTDRGWLCADGAALLSVDGLPIVSAAADLVLTLPEGFEFTGFTVYDQTLTRVTDGETLDALSSLPAGAYTLAIHVVQTGRFIAAEDQHEYFGYDGLCTLVVE